MAQPEMKMTISDFQFELFKVRVMTVTRSDVQVFWSDAY